MKNLIKKIINYFSKDSFANQVEEGLSELLENSEKLRKEEFTTDIQEKLKHEYAYVIDFFANIFHNEAHRFNFDTNICNRIKVEMSYQIVCNVYPRHIDDSELITHLSTYILSNISPQFVDILSRLKPVRF